MSFADPFEDVEDEDVDLDELRVALEDLPQGDPVALSPPRRRDRGGDIDWMELFSELRRRAGTFGMVERSGAVDEFGLDEVVLERSGRLLDFLLERYWRVELGGARERSR